VSTGVDILAPAVGNMHGMLRSMVQGETKKHLDIERISAIKQAAQVFLTLHGGSGTDGEDLKQSHYNGNQHCTYQYRTAGRVETWFGTGLSPGLAQQPNEVAPYKILPTAVDSVRRVVVSRLRLFTGEAHFTHRA
jgi:fructose-bisphosphate aldolase, class II